MQEFFGTDKIAFDITSTRFPTTPRHYDSFSDALDEVIDARVWGGIHFRTADEQGAELGKKVAQWEKRHYFQPTGTSGKPGTCAGGDIASGTYKGLTVTGNCTIPDDASVTVAQCVTSSDRRRELPEVAGRPGPGSTPAPPTTGTCSRVEVCEEQDALSRSCQTPRVSAPRRRRRCRRVRETHDRLSTLGTGRPAPAGLPPTEDGAWPREESNLRAWIRSPPLYPLSYGALLACTVSCVGAWWR